MIQPKLWNGNDLTGAWHVTIKIDGVRALWVDGAWQSRAGKPLLNIPHPVFATKTEMWWPGDDCELYLGSLADSVRACRTKHLKPDTPRITHEHLYSLDPIDKRLDLGLVKDPPAEWILSKLRTVNAQGFEGLVLRSGDTWLKVKPSDNFDVLVLDMEEGEGKHKGRMGKLITHMGAVGTGFTDEERQHWWNRRIQYRDGKPPHLPPGLKFTIEVECMHLTPDGKFRHARFIRERFDKVADK